MELRHLRYFVELADELHFGRAAVRLGISQPPLSQQIRLLEAELGVALFERSSRRVRLTEAGRLFLTEARATLAQAEHAVSTVRRLTEGEIGELAIGFTPSSLFVPPVSETIAAFRRLHPQVHLDLAEQTLKGQREAFARGALDVGLCRNAHRPALPDGLAARAVTQDRMVLAMAAEHPLAADPGPIAVSDLAGQPMVHYPYDREGFLEDLWRVFERAGVQPHFVQETREMSTLLGLVAAGLGITVLAGSLRRLSVDTLRYREIADSDATSTLWLLHRIEPRPAARRFLALVEERLPAGA